MSSKGLGNCHGKMFMIVETVSTTTEEKKISKDQKGKIQRKSTI